MAAAICVAGTILAQSKAPKTPSKIARKADAPKREYKPGDMHRDKSSVYILVDKTGLGHQHAVAGKLKEGSVHLAARQETDRLVFDMTTFEADDAAARKYVGLNGLPGQGIRQQVTANMLGEDVLHVEKYPTATLAITSIEKLKEPSERDLPQYEIKGKFTLHGETNEISVLADAEDKGEWTRLRGYFSLLQSDYGITPYSKSFGVAGVADELQIWADFWLAN